MIEPRSYVAFARRGAGLMCALFYFADERSVYGWYTGSRAGEFPARFFMLADYFSPHATRLYAAPECDLNIVGTLRRHRSLDCRPDA
ncbi:MAG: hypothetical protein M5U08_24535 [Burkholderiales bacterium]|nr:hypothetical protein [Burkholderiales bacterium]